MRAEQKGSSLSEDKKIEQKKIRAISLLNRTSKRLESKNLDKTFGSFSTESKSITAPPPRSSSVNDPSRIEFKISRR